MVKPRAMQGNQTDSINALNVSRELSIETVFGQFVQSPVRFPQAIEPRVALG